MRFQIFFTYICPMKKESLYINRILQAADQLYRKHGFRAVSMDDLAKEIGMSKKTIYKFFSSKNKLVEALVMEHTEKQRQEISAIVEKNNDPIKTMVEIGQLVSTYYTEMSPDIILELKKYFFEIWQQVDKMQTEQMLLGITKNLIAGVKLGLYRKEIDPEFIAKVYVNSVISACDNDDQITGKALYYMMLLQYHLQGVMTEKGRRLFEKYKASFI